jgi:hypothetical protein
MNVRNRRPRTDVYSRKVSAILRPVALCALLILGVSPAATLVCQWACASEATTGGHHAGHHAESSEAVQASETPVGGPSVRASEMNCHHPDIALSVTSVTVQMFAPSLGPVTALVAPRVDGYKKLLVPYATGSPPGARSTTPSLRI